MLGNSGVGNSDVAEQPRLPQSRQTHLLLPPLLPATPPPPLSVSPGHLHLSLHLNRSSAGDLFLVQQSRRKISSILEKACSFRCSSTQSGRWENPNTFAPLLPGALPGHNGSVAPQGDGRRPCVGHIDEVTFQACAIPRYLAQDTKNPMHKMTKKACRSMGILSR